MPLRDLNHSEREIVRRVLVFQFERWDWETSTVLGVEKEEVADLLLRWESLDDSDQASSAHRAIHSSLGDLVGLRGISEDDCRSGVGVTPQELFNLYKRWKAGFEPQSPLGFLA